MSKVDSEQTIEQRARLTMRQVAALKEAGFTQQQIDALPKVRGLSDEQILFADALGIFPGEDLTLEEIAALAANEIDFSDIPELDDEFWKKAKVVKPQSD